mgnify:CR=1 FL=1
MPVVWFFMGCTLQSRSYRFIFFVDSVDDCNHSYDCRFIALLCLATYGDEQAVENVNKEAFQNG